MKQAIIDFPNLLRVYQAKQGARKRKSKMYKC